MEEMIVLTGDLTSSHPAALFLTDVWVVGQLGVAAVRRRNAVPLGEVFGALQGP